MPIFEYSCMKCGYRFEKLQKADPTDQPECPMCSSAEVNRLLSSFSSAGSSSSAADCYSGG